MPCSYFVVRLICGFFCVLSLFCPNMLGYVWATRGNVGALPPTVPPTVPPSGGVGSGVKRQSNRSYPVSRCERFCCGGWWRLLWKDDTEHSTPITLIHTPGKPYNCHFSVIIVHRPKFFLLGLLLMKTSGCFFFFGSQVRPFIKNSGIPIKFHPHRMQINVVVAFPQYKGNFCSF